ncbi:hypothetical protein R1flu_021780 [Riccia fluitans]|uniref:AAA+ ATPase domain-containing protein n=1 Tax=Riccia fluitans TaxID=41844 RepID=A0ABD1ZQZ5_9MARC
MPPSKERNQKQFFYPATSEWYQPYKADQTAQRSQGDQHLVRLTDAVYQVYKPDGNPRAQIVFFHGIRRQDFSRAYIETWKTSDGSECWPQSWLPRYFSKAAVYLVSYDSSASVDSTHGRLDMFTAGEQLLANLLLAKIGQHRNCPLILVGHDLGGLLIKHICLQADEGRSRRSSDCERMAMFLRQIRGIFFFSTPHGGVCLKTKFSDEESAMMTAMKPFTTEISVCNEEFSRLRHLPQYRWKTKGIQGSHGHKPGQLNYSHPAAGRQDVDAFCVIDTDSDNICKPMAESSTSFQLLVQFIKDLVETFASNHRASLPFSEDKSYVPIRSTIEEVQKLLLNNRIVVLYGEPGTGKTSLAKYVALKYQEQTEHHSMFWDGCFFVECGRKTLAAIQDELHRQMRVDAKDLNTHLQRVDALIVLDNVWDYETVRQLVVPGSNVKYLVTAQLSNIWRDDQEIAFCRMEKIGHFYGRQIIAKKVGFRDGKLPKEIEDTVDDLLNATDCHPLALATLSMSVQSERKAVREEWVMVKRSMDTLLRQDWGNPKPVAFGHKYPRGVYVSMMYGMELLHERSKEALTLLCIVALFEGPSVPLKLIQLFVETTHVPHLPERDSNAGVYRLMKQLEGRSLLQLLFKGKIKDVMVSMNGLRRRFILSADNGPVANVRRKIMKLLSGEFRPQEDQLNQCNMARFLCTVYGAQEIRECLDPMAGQTEARLSSRTKHNSAGISSEKKLFLEEPRSSNGFDAEKVLGTYIYQGLQDSDRLMRFARSTVDAGSTICRALVALFLASYQSKLSWLSLEACERFIPSFVNLILSQRKPSEILNIVGTSIHNMTSAGHNVRKALLSAFSSELAVEEKNTPVDMTRRKQEDVRRNKQMRDKLKNEHEGKKNNETGNKSRQEDRKKGKNEEGEKTSDEVSKKMVLILNQQDGRKDERKGKDEQEGKKTDETQNKNRQEDRRKGKIEEKVSQNIVQTQQDGKNGGQKGNNEHREGKTIEQKYKKNDGDKKENQYTTRQIKEAQEGSKISAYSTSKWSSGQTSSPKWASSTGSSPHQPERGSGKQGLIQERSKRAVQNHHKHEESSSHIRSSVEGRSKHEDRHSQTQKHLKHQQDGNLHQRLIRTEKKSLFFMYCCGGTADTP